MADASKFLGSAITGLSKILAVDPANLSKIMGLDIDTGGSLGRGIVGGGTTASAKIDTIQYIQIDTLSNTSNFGTLSTVRTAIGVCGNGQTGRLLFGGGIDNSSRVATIEYVTVGTLGNAANFGSLTAARYTHAGSSNRENDRAVWGGGVTTAKTEIIDYVTVSSLSSATDFGDLTLSRYSLGAATNGTNERCVFIGGKLTSSSFTTTMDYITVNSASNATSFGSMTVATGDSDSTSNFTNERGITAGGITGSATRTAKIEYITINSLGNGTTFGNLIVAKNALGALSNGESERGVFFGGSNQSSVPQDEIEYITINSLGNAALFGYMSTGVYNLRGDSDA